MSSLKKDIEEVLLEFRADYITSERATPQIINLIESVVGEDEDLPEDVSSVGFDEWQERRTRNQLRADIKSKLIGKE